MSQQRGPGGANRQGGGRGSSGDRTNQQSPQPALPPNWDDWFLRLIAASDRYDQFNHIPDYIRNDTDPEMRAIDGLTWIENELGIGEGILDERNFVTRCRVALQHLALWQPSAQGGDQTATPPASVPQAPTPSTSPGPPPAAPPAPPASSARQQGSLGKTVWNWFKER